MKMEKKVLRAVDEINARWGRPTMFTSEKYAERSRQLGYVDVADWIEESPWRFTYLLVMEGK